jgi:CRISPR-associated protein Csx14
MHETRIPVDLRNPGQVFACHGFAEACETLFDDRCEIRFDYRDFETATTCTIFAERTRNAVHEVLRFLHGAEASTVIPNVAGFSNAHLSTAKWKVAEVEGAAGFSPSAVPSAAATLPVLLKFGDRKLLLHHWADSAASGRDNVKFWAGSGGYPASAIARDMLSAIAALPTSDLDRLSQDPFSYAVPMTGGFRFDWRRDYVPLDAGFSPNRHGNVSMVGFPVTELVAAIGLQHARPARASRRDKLHYRFAVSSTRLSLPFARPLLGDGDLGFPKRTFRMVLDWPGQAGQARCIIDAQEET